MTENNPKPVDPTKNVNELIDDSIRRLDDLRHLEVKRLDEKINANDVKYQVQFNAAKDAVSIALIAQEKAVAAALDAAKEATSKSEISMDKRFDLLSKKIDELMETISKSTGAQGIYVTHTDLNVALDKLQTNIETALRPLVNFMNMHEGKQQIADPVMAQLLLEVKALRESSATTTGSGEGMTKMYGWIVGGIMVFITIASFVIDFSK